jgi:hypothetical protein
MFLCFFCGHDIVLICSDIPVRWFNHAISCYLTALLVPIGDDGNKIDDQKTDGKPRMQNDGECNELMRMN